MTTAWPCVTFDGLPAPHEVPATGIVRFIGIDPIVAAASLLTSGVVIDGLWITVSDEYAAAIAARDIATLSFLGPISNVVIDAAELGASAAELIDALLTNDSVTFSNEAGTLVDAFNRPSPQEAPRVWWVRDGVAHREGEQRTIAS